jgi:hypothetical protein
MSEPEGFTQVLLLGDEKRSADVAAALWAALLEVEVFYTPYRKVPVQRFYLGDGPPVSLDPRLTEAQRAMVGRFSIGPMRERARGRFGKVDQEQLARYVHDALRAFGGDDHSLIVTDFEITPPPDSRYIIWGGVSGGAVVSSAPLDPRYWRMPEERRSAVLKHRVRTACLSITGEWLGFSRCENTTCFLYDNVDSVTTLDTMVQFGAEHKVADLAFRGFAPVNTEPERVQLVIERPPTGELLA